MVTTKDDYTVCLVYSRCTESFLDGKSALNRADEMHRGINGERERDRYFLQPTLSLKVRLIQVEITINFKHSI